MLKRVSFVLFFISFFVNIYFRLTPVYFPAMKEWAETLAKKELQAHAEKFLTDRSRSSLVKNILQKESILFESEVQKKKLHSRIEQIYRKLKDPYQDLSGQTYLLELDGYHWKRYVKNILQHGSPGDITEDKQEYDIYTLAPVGVPVFEQKGYFYLSAFFIKVIQYFFPAVKFDTAIFYLPLVYFFIFFCVLYGFIRYVFSNVAAFFSTLFIGLSGAWIQRSSAGWFDYDSLIVTLPLLASWLIITALYEKTSFLKRFFFSILSAIVVFFYAFTWAGYGWWWLLLASFFIFSLINSYLISHSLKTDSLKYLLVGSICILTSILLVIFFLHRNLILNIFQLAGLFTSSTIYGSIWPNVYYTVRELLPFSISEILGHLHGGVIASFSLCGFLYIFLKERRSEKKDFLLLTFLWLVGMFYASLKSQRFVLFLIVPFGISFGIFTVEIGRYLFRDFLKKHAMITSNFFRIRRVNFVLGKNISLYFGRILFVGFMMFSFVRFGLSARTTADTLIPIMNDSWQSALAYLKQETPKEAIINTMWDYGVFIETESQRRVLYDGISQDGFIGYWITRVLLSTSEKESLRILRMLNNSSCLLRNELWEELHDSFEAGMLLQLLISSEFSQTEKIFDMYTISPNLRKRILDVLYIRRPDPAYLFIDKGLFRKMKSISFLRNWNFAKLYISQNKDRLSQNRLIQRVVEKFGISVEQAEGFYADVLLASVSKDFNEVLSERWEMSQVPSFGLQQGEVVLFNNNIVFDLKDKKGYVFSLEQQKYNQLRFITIFDTLAGTSAYYENKDANLESGGIVIHSPDGWKSLLVSHQELASALFAKLYFLNGKELEYFKPVYSDPEGGIFIFKIIWPE